MAARRMKPTMRAAMSWLVCSRQAVASPTSVKPAGEVAERYGAEPLDEGRRGLAGGRLEVAGGALAQVAELALELGDELVAHQGAGRVVRDLHQLGGELGEADGGVDHHRLHGGDGGERLVDAHGVEDAEALLADLVAGRVARPSIWSKRMRLLTRRRNTRLQISGTSSPVVSRSTVTATLGSRSFL